jgi:hypothetical protein
MSIVIDTTTYNIPFKVVGRKAELLFRYAERDQNGNFHGESIGTYYNYSVECGQSINNVSDYAALWVKLTDPNFEHEITMPDETGDLTFNCYFANIRDDVRTWKADNTVYFRNLSFDIIATSPARTP